MPILAIALLLSGAVLHTAWNLLLKQSKDKYVASWWMVITGGIIALFTLLFTGLPVREMWKFAVFSILAEALYFITLSYAYHDNEFSLIYPIARGAAPAFLALWSFLFLGEQPTAGGLLGLGLIVVGAVLFLRYSLARFMRFWLLRLIYEERTRSAAQVAASDRLADLIVRDRHKENQS